MAQLDALNPNTAAPAPASVAPSRAARLPDEVLALYAFTTATLAGLAAGFAIMTMLFWASTPHSVFVPWAALFVGLWFVRVALAQAFRRALKGGGTMDWAHWQRLWNILTLCSAGAWGLSGWIFYSHSIGIQQTGLIVTIYTFCIAVVPVLGNHPRMFVAYVAICFGPLIVRIATGGDDYSFQLAGMLLIIVSLTTALARNYRHTLQRLLEHKLRADSLAAQLRVEKQAAEAARALGVRIHTIGLSSADTFSVALNGVWTVRNVNARLSGRDEEVLKDISTRTGGQFYKATDPNMLTEVLKEIDPLERIEVKVSETREWHELFPILVGIGLALLLLEMLLRLTWLRALP